MRSTTVVVMFTDLVDSTAMMSRVGESSAEVLRREHFSITRDAISHHGGTEVKNLGDGIMAVFDSAVDGIRSAVELQRALERRNRGAEEPLRVRVGLAMGDVDIADDDYFGVAVVQAARLCAHADGDEILLTDVVKAVSGSRSEVVLEPVGEIQLKGLPAAVPVSRACWLPADTEERRAALPSRLAAAVTSQFAGRRREQALLETAWKRAEAGARQLVLVSGEPGIGKTSLAAKLCADVWADGGQVAYGRCDEGLGITYQPWTEALGQLVVGLPEADLSEHVARWGSTLGRLVPDVLTSSETRPASGGDGAGEQLRLFGAVIDVLERAAARCPVVIVLDDLHWVDRASAQLLRHVITRTGDLSLMVIGTFRDSDVGALDPISELAADMHREDDTHRLSLSGLDDDDLMELLEGIAGHTLDDDGVGLRDALSSETSGNPFFVLEMLRHLVESSVIEQNPDGRWQFTGDADQVGLPVSVKEVVGRRLTLLGETATKVLVHAAVVGRDFDLDLVAAVSRLDVETVIDVCDAATAAAVLKVTDDPDRYTFAHALIERTLYDSLSPARRSRAHRAVAEEIERQCGPDPGDRVGELAHHWALATRPEEGDRAVHYAAVAGRRALARLAPDDAIGWFDRALELSDPVVTRERAELMLDLGIAQRYSGRPEYRETLLGACRAAEDLDAPDIYIRAALQNHRGFSSTVGSSDTERIAVLERALDLVGSAPTVERALLLAHRASETQFVESVAARRPFVEEAVAIARGCADDHQLVDVLVRAADLLFTDVDADVGGYLGEACELADRTGDPIAIRDALRCDLRQRLFRGDGQAMRAAWQALVEIRDQVPREWYSWTLNYTGAMVAVVEGDLSEAERLAEVAVAEAAGIEPDDVMFVFGAQLVNVRHHQGRLHEVLDLVADAAETSTVPGVFRSVLALAAARSGQHDRARALLDRVVADGPPAAADLAGQELMTPTGFVCAAEAAEVVGHREAATVLYDQMLPLHGTVVTTLATVDGAMDLHLARMARVMGLTEEADAWFASASELNRRLGSPLFVADTDVAWAAHLLDRARPDDRARARDLLDAALEVSTTRGYGYIATAARDGLARLEATTG